MCRACSEGLGVLVLGVGHVVLFHQFLSCTPHSYFIDLDARWLCIGVYNYLCNQCLSPLTLWVRILLVVRCTQCNIISLAAGWWFSPVLPVSSTTDNHDITEILLKVTLNTNTLTWCIGVWSCYFKLYIISFIVCCRLTFFWDSFQSPY